MKTTSKISLIGAAGLSLFALSACSADEMPIGQLSLTLEDHTDAREASCDEDLVLSDGEQVSCDASLPGADGDQSMTVTFNEDYHALLADNPVTYIRTTIYLDQEDNSALSDESDDDAKEYFRDAIPVDELEEIADEHFRREIRDQYGMEEEGEERPEPPTSDCDSDLDTTVTTIGEGPTCEVDGSTWEVAMESDIEVVFDPGGGFDRPFVYDLSSGDFRTQE